MSRSAVVGRLWMPAIVVSRYQDVLAANPIAHALSPGFEVGQNLSRWRFLDPATRDVYPDWDEATALAGGGLREVSADDPDDPIAGAWRARGLHPARACVIYGHNMFSANGYAYYYYYGRYDWIRLGTPLL